MQSAWRSARIQRAQGDKELTAKALLSVGCRPRASESLARNQLSIGRYLDLHWKPMSARFAV